MKYIAICVMAVLVAGTPALSQEASKAKPAPCVDVEIGQDKAAALNCMNDAIRAKVEHTQGTPNLSAPIDARSPGNQVGTFNNQAAQEQMGSAYGVSSKPQRPKAVFMSPLLPPAAAH
jgi:hypothetical protein